MHRLRLKKKTWNTLTLKIPNVVITKTETKKLGERVISQENIERNK